MTSEGTSILMTEAPLTTTIKAPGANAPWIVIRSENTSQLSQQLAEVQANTTFADLARAQEAFNAHFTVGAVLGGRGVAAPADTGAFAPPAPAPVAAAPTQEEQFAAFLAAQNTAGMATAAPAAAPTAPVTAAQYGGGGGDSTPGAPLVGGMPAKLVSGSSARGPWQAWADPRPKEATDHMQKTDDPYHPGLSAGTHKLWKFIR
jgi:hypothetical protein